MTATEPPARAALTAGQLAEIAEFVHQHYGIDNPERLTGEPLSKVLDRLPEGAVVADPSDWRPRAVTVGRLGWQAVQAGRRGRYHTRI